MAEKTANSPKSDKPWLFQKGQSGNPKGRPKKPVEIEALAKRAPKELEAIADDPATPVKVRSDIWKFFYEAQYGKATQAVDMSGEMAVKPVVFEGESDIAD